MKLGVTPVSTLPATGNEAISSFYGPVVNTTFNPTDIPGALGFLNMNQSDDIVQFVGVGSGPERYDNSLDCNPNTVHPFESNGTTRPVMIREIPGSVKGQLDFDIAEANGIRVKAINALPVGAGNPRSVAFRMFVPSALAAGFTYTISRSSTDYIAINNNKIGVYNGGVYIWTPTLAFCDDDWHNFIIRSDSTDGLSIWIDGVEVQTDPSHHFQFDMVASAFGRILSPGHALNLRGSLRHLSYYDHRLSDANCANLDTWMTANF